MYLKWRYIKFLESEGGEALEGQEVKTGEHEDFNNKFLSLVGEEIERIDSACIVNS